MCIIDDSVLICAEELKTERDEVTGELLAAETTGKFAWIIEHSCGAITDLLADYCQGCGMKL